MLDVHAPHKPMHGMREFFLHIFTITVGLLIATQIEGCVTWQEHRHLAQEARASLREEIQHNLDDLRGAQPGLKLWRGQVDADLAAMRRIQRQPSDPAAQNATLDVRASGIRLNDMAWKTAQTTGALAYMPYDEAKRYASIYESQAALMDLQEKPTEDVARIIGLIQRFDWNKDHKITPAEAGGVAEYLGTMQLHLADGTAVLDECVEQDAAFLENRQPKKDFSESVETK